MGNNETLKKIYAKYDYLVFVCGMDYVLEKGMFLIAKLTDEQISDMKGDGYFGDDFIRAIAKCGREIAQSNCSFHDLYSFCTENIWPKKDERMEEIAYTALSYLEHHRLLNDYLDKKNVELTDKERDFFELEREDDFDWDEE